MRKAQKLFADADRSSRVGDLEAATKTLDELEKLLPGDPGVLFRKALLLERLDQPAEASTLLEELLKYPGLPRDMQSQAQAKLEQLAQSLASRETPPANVSSASRTRPARHSGRHRFATGSQSRHRRRPFA